MAKAYVVKPKFTFELFKMIDFSSYLYSDNTIAGHNMTIIICCPQF